MAAHRLNRYSKKSRGNRIGLYQAGRVQLKPILDDQTGFIYHPSGFPIDVKELRFWERGFRSDIDSGRIGLIFESGKYIKPGTILAIEIPVRDGIEKFRGKVVLVRDYRDYYEIGLWLCQSDDANRARVVEQLCHIEIYMQEKKYREGPYSLNRERLAREWISKYAASVPSP